MCSLICEKCKQPITEDRWLADGENGWCIDCFDEYQQEQDRYWRPQYEAEKAAGLLMSEEERNEQLRQAGRGHLVRETGNG